MGKSVDHKQSLVLSRHHNRRAQGVPTLSLLVGDVDVAEWCWTGWQGAAASAFARSSAASGDALLDDWLSSSALRGALLSALAERGAAEDRVSREEFATRLRALAESQRQLAFEQLSARLGWSAALIDVVTSADGAALARWARASFPRSLSEIESVARAALPGLLALPPRTASAADLRSQLTTLLRIAEAVPRLELGCALSEAQFVRWRQEADARELHLVGEGLVRVEPAVGEPEPAPEPGVARRSRSSQRRAALSRDANAAVPRLEYDADEFARSRAERALHDHLEARPRTSGLFVLNRSLPETFGTRPLEIDLFSEALHIALEVDGYHHFRDAAAYRRDRDKDVLLQRLGYTVVRVLASDIDTQLEYVTETIDRVVEHARRERANPEQARRRQTE